jgi:hypothetical protein
VASIRDKRLTLAAATLGAFVALLDSTAVSVALPAVRVDLGGGLQTQQWVINAYVLTLASLILVGGALSDVFGERRVFVVGAAGFGALSAGCAVAPTVEALIAARAVQGMFGALLTPASLAVIVAAFPPDERGTAIATWTAYSGIAALVGPLVSAAGVLYLLATVDGSPDFFLDIVPGIMILAVGLAIVVAPLTAAIVAGADEQDAGIASGVYNAVVRVASLLATAAAGTIAGGTLDLDGFQVALAVAAGLLALGGATGLCGFRSGPVPARPSRAGRGALGES